MPAMLSVFTVAPWISIAVCTPGTKFPKSLVRDGQEPCSFSKSTRCSPKLNEPSLADYSFLAGLTQQNPAATAHQKFALGTSCFNYKGRYSRSPA